MKNYFVAVSFFTFITLLCVGAFAQVESPAMPPSPTPTPAEISDSLAAKSEAVSQKAEVSSERRQKAYAKLLEGQRYLWSMPRLSSELGKTGARLAKNAFQEAVELNPNLAEAYTALAELTAIAPPQDIDEAIMFAEIATKLDKDNFGGHRILARLYTIKSNLGRGKLETESTNKAIKEWQEVGRLDPRNAEAWAFLSEFYGEQNKKDLQISSLKKWISAASPIETFFFNKIMANRTELTSEEATLKLGEALLENGDSQAALEILSRSIADDPGNPKAVELFRQSMKGADNNSLLGAIETLRQAIFVNPDNESLIQLLAQTLAKIGQIDDAAKVLRGAVSDNVSGNKDSASNLQVVLGDIFAESKRTNEAIDAYQNALKIRGVEDSNPAAGEDRDFAIRVVGKMIQTYKKANRPDDAKILIDKYRALFGKNDLFADKELKIKIG